MRNCFRQNKILFFFSLGFLLFYACFVFFMHTPWYTAAQFKFAYHNHNTAILMRTIDLESVISNGYDDVTCDLFIYNSNIQPKTKQTFEQFYKLIKKDICDGTLVMIDKYLKDNVWHEPTGTSVLKGREMGIDYDELLERSMLRNTSIKGIGSLSKDDNGNYILPVTVADRYTDTDFVINLLLQKNTEGIWKITKIINYRNYLEHVRNLYNADITTYINDTKAQTAEYNRTFQGIQLKFQAMTKPIGANISNDQRAQIQKFILSEVIPAYTSHENYLQNVNVPPGASHLHMLRLQSNAKTIEAWKYFAEGIGKDSKDDLSKAECSHQEALVLEQKVSDIMNKMPALFVPEIP
ncbi:hypothetical protein [Pectinatus cerevisiiphilus]|uniref:Uncharacterized protein n=2 Tax=Pectinatus cerevisiiphilus TaxID=86956 RepID=A0A4R3KAJ1_9FIRM|nr:hypothetical protein [Pectinatus cerevisiiphilus]TCS80114.1 hypothetical protein EDC37_105186 [Pectinatus cerevisiiphilus]